MAGAAVCFSTGGLFVRHLPALQPQQIVFWRSLFAGAFIFCVLTYWHRGALPARVRAAGRAGLVSACFLAATFFFFIFSISHTTVANAAALMSTGPLFLAVAAWAFLGERPRTGTWFAIAAALAGTALMFSEGFGAGQMLGNLLALGVPAAFTVNYIVLRRAPAATDPTVAALLAALLAVTVAAPLAWPLAISLRDLAVVAALGIIQIGCGLVLMTRAYHRLSAGELGLISLAEPVLAPLWVWLAISERPGAAALAGGVLVLAAVFLNQLLLFRAAARSTRSSCGLRDRDAPAQRRPGDSAP
ncbi:MAG: DMT family transporter [Betaproteobacteria bacterium]|nr:MAG: DMT family transporter [Betaproteobacteria bacterium]